MDSLYHASGNWLRKIKGAHSTRKHPRAKKEQSGNSRRSDAVDTERLNNKVLKIEKVERGDKTKSPEHKKNSHKSAPGNRKVESCDKKEGAVKHNSVGAKGQAQDFRVGTLGNNITSIKPPKVA